MTFLFSQYILRSYHNLDNFVQNDFQCSVNYVSMPQCVKRRLTRLTEKKECKICCGKSQTYVNLWRTCVFAASSLVIIAFISVTMFFS